jgi:opacity protein-like surface antigen
MQHGVTSAMLSLKNRKGDSNMKKNAGILFILLVLLFSSSVAMADDTKGIYVGILGGYVLPDDASANFTTVGIPTYQYDATMKNGYLLGAKVGWLTPFTKRILAVELEYNYLHSNFDTAKNILGPITSDLEGKVNMHAMMLNLLARFPLGIFHPYVGAGAGYALVDVDDHLVSMGGSPVFILGGGSQKVFAYQLMAGFDVDVTKNVIVNVAYKYIAPQKVSYDSNINGVAPPGIYNEEMNFKFQAITMGISYMF